MTNIAEQIWEILDNEPCIRRDLSRGLINIRALAKYLIQNKKINGTLDSIISAIRRYKLDKYEEIFVNAHKIMSKTTSLSTRSNLANIALIKDTEIQALTPKLYSLIQHTRGEILRIIQADESIKVLINEKNLKKIINILPKEKILSIDENLAEINLHLTPEAKDTPGVLAIISNELALNRVSIVEMLSCFPEILWFVYQKDLLKAYSVLYQLCQPDKK